MSVYIYLYIVHVCAFDVNRNYLLHDTDKLKIRKDKWKQVSKQARKQTHYVVVYLPKRS